MSFSLTWPYARMPFVVTRRRGRRSLPKRLMLMKTARFLAGWDACGAAVRVLFKDDVCQTDGFRTCTMVGTYGRFGLSIVNPTEGAAKRWRVI